MFTFVTGQGRTRERASEMKSYGVCMSAREMRGRGSRLFISLVLTQTTYDSISLARSPARPWVYACATWNLKDSSMALALALAAFDNQMARRMAGAVHNAVQDR